MKSKKAVKFVSTTKKVNKTLLSQLVFAKEVAPLLILLASKVGLIRRHKFRTVKV